MKKNYENVSNKNLSFFIWKFRKISDPDRGCNLVPKLKVTSFFCDFSVEVEKSRIENRTKLLRMVPGSCAKILDFWSLKICKNIFFCPKFFTKFLVTTRGLPKSFLWFNLIWKNSLFKKINTTENLRLLNLIKQFRPKVR